MNAAYTAYREIKIAQNKKRRMRIVRRQRLLLAFFIALFVFLAVFWCTTTILQARSDKTTYKYYTSITIHSSDTLESIAKKYISDEYKDMDEYINEVEQINHLYDSRIIPGENIIVPYYSAEYK